MRQRFDTTHGPDRPMPGHRHRYGYVALVNDGCYQEDSVDGRYDCQAGMAIVHPPLHSHANRFPNGSVQVSNATLTIATRYRALRLSPRHFRQARLTRNPDQLLAIVLSEGRAVAPASPPASVHAMAEALADDPQTRIDALARSLNLTPEHAARQFKRHTGLTPAQYRSEHRLRGALRDLSAGQSAIEVAHRRGYSDQSHLCRAVKSATSITIGELVASNLFKTTGNIP